MDEWTNKMIMDRLTNTVVTWIVQSTCTVPLNVPMVFPFSLVTTDSHNLSDISAATFLAVKRVHEYIICV